MRKILLAIALAAALAPEARSEGWSIGAASGPFIFGHFAERVTPIVTESGSGSTSSRLSAATRAGAAIDVERDFNGWLALRLEGTWTRAPLRIKSASGDQGVTFEAGNANVTTLVIPVVVHLNRHGAVRFHLMGGPAYALYNIHRRVGGGATAPLFEGTRGRLGGAGGVGVEWWWTGRFGLEWRAQDIVTASPFRAQDIAPSGKGVRILKPQNGHTTIGIRYRF